MYKLVFIIITFMWNICLLRQHSIIYIPEMKRWINVAYSSHTVVRFTTERWSMS